MTPDELRAHNREKMRRWRAEQREKGRNLYDPTPEQRAASTERQRRYREQAEAEGRILAADTWHLRNPDAHRARVRRYRADNPDRMREVGRIAQAERRSTPWGQINNNLVVVVHEAVRRASQRPKRAGKYQQALGYSWLELRAHLEAQFTPEMTWDNWGSYWELDHIVPLSSFKYESLDDPRFRECWDLSNLRPLRREENASKGNRPIE